MNNEPQADIRKRLSELFSGYRAEWLAERIFDLFTEPSYFPQLVTSHPCFLEGGRGTGKTTALRSLSYRGQSALRANSPDQNISWNYFGMYYRVNTNRVRAFAGDELPERQWVRLFAHYLNLELTELVIDFLTWYANRYPTTPLLAVDSLQLPATSLGLENVASIEDFAKELRLSKLTFEYNVNNVADPGELPQLSMQGAPVDLLMEQVKDLPCFADQSFFFVIDEYENLDDSQQRVLNTLIKHCGRLYSFKVGVRELGFRERSTLNQGEKLTHPADYRLINITDELGGQNRFSTFAADVCTQRLHQVMGSETTAPDIVTMLPELSAEQEADALGVRSTVTSTIEELQNSEAYGKEFQEWICNVHPLEVFVLVSRAQIEGITVSAKLSNVLNDRYSWKVHYENYKHAYLFAIRRGKSGIRKYFAGWRVFCSISGANIRYLLELVDQSLSRHLDAGSDPDLPISSKIQTQVAQVTGQRNLRELEGLSLNGAKLTRFLLGLGRVFQVMAVDPVGHTPEVNQFYLATSTSQIEDIDRVDGLLTDGIMHLALLRYPGSKLQQHTDVRDFDYTIHPIFSAFFGFSHRRKRKIELSYQDILNLVDQPSEAISEILTGQNRTESVANEIDLPEQLELFRDYYANNQ